jgi:tetratricopeptide (TPR) repeat protein
MGEADNNNKKDRRGSVAGEPPPARAGMAGWAGLAHGDGDEENKLKQGDNPELPRKAEPEDWLDALRDLHAAFDDPPDEQATGGDFQAEIAPGAEAEPVAGDLAGSAAGGGAEPSPDHGEEVWPDYESDDLPGPGSETPSHYESEILPDYEEPPFDDEAADDGDEPAGQVWGAAGERVPFFEHALYAEAMQALAAGKGAAVVSNLGELADIYPDEPAIRDLMLRMELKTAVAQERELPADHKQAAPALQTALTVLLLLTIGLAGAAGFYVAFQRLVRPIWDANIAAAEIRRTVREIEYFIDGGAWNDAEKTLLELQERQGPGEWIAERLDYVRRQRQLINLYTEALSLQDVGRLPEALVLYQQTAAIEPDYRDVARRVEDINVRLAIEMDWLAAEDRIQAEDWEEATALLLDIRGRDPTFRPEQVKERLFQIYERLARQSLSGAGGNPDRLREALVYLNGALGERPGHQEFRQQRMLALAYLRGVDAQARGDWVQAVQEWEAAAARDPNYQGGVLATRLREAYPRAARQALATANGSIDRLEQALVYLGRALRDAPDDEGLLQERAMAMAYVEGARAFQAGFWNQAIRYWGPLFAVQPGYQNGVLERNLKQACGASPDPDLAVCAP